jgi:hypothetical protein
MSDIVLPARLEIGKNGGFHGHIVFSDGTLGEEFASREEALKRIQEALSSGKIIDIEAASLRKAINDLALQKIGDLVVDLVTEALH